MIGLAVAFTAGLIVGSAGCLVAVALGMAAGDTDDRDGRPRG